MKHTRGLKEFEDDLRYYFKNELTSKYKLFFRHYPEILLFQTERQFKYKEKPALKGQVLIENISFQAPISSSKERVKHTRGYSFMHFIILCEYSVN